MEIAFRVTAADGDRYDQYTACSTQKSKDKDPRGRGSHGESETRSVTRRNIEGQGLELRRNPDGGLIVDVPDGNATGQLVAVLLPHESNQVRSVLLIQGASESTVLVNGHPPLPLAPLDEGAEISVDGELLLYRERSPAEIVSFEGAKGERCIRCKRILNHGDAIQRCSQCDSPFHEGPRAGEVTPGELLCASYDAQCARCAQPWDAMRWNPEEVFDD